jgi:hypothetical protein
LIFLIFIEDEDVSVVRDDGCVNGFVVTSVAGVLFDDGTAGNSGNAFCPYAILLHIMFIHITEIIIPNTDINLTGLILLEQISINAILTRIINQTSIPLIRPLLQFKRRQNQL